MLRGGLLVVCLLCAPFAPVAAAPETATQAIHATAETRLVEALDQVRQGNYGRAIRGLSDLIANRPNFRLAQYVYGELMVARAGGAIDPAIGKRLGDMREALLNEARTRWTHRMQAAARGEQVPGAILQLAPEYQHAIVVDLLNNRLYLFENDGGLARLIGDFYATIGSAGAGKRVEGDMRTPVGVYTITRYRDDASLPELYGVGAFPVNYPNALDEARGRTGYGIWLHGVPRTTYARAPRASEGCVAIANDVFKLLRKYVDPGVTPIIFTAEMTWLSIEEAKARRKAVLARLKGWEESWETINTEAHLEYYADGFVTADGLSKSEFAERKYDVNAHKTNIAVELDQLSIFRYPGETQLIKISFDQAYASNNYDSSGEKSQFWRRVDDGEWRIVMERSGG